MVVVAGLSATAANASQRLTTYKLPADPPSRATWWSAPTGPRGSPATRPDLEDRRERPHPLLRARPAARRDRRRGRLDVGRRRRRRRDPPRRDRRLSQRTRSTPARSRSPSPPAPTAPCGSPRAATTRSAASRSTARSPSTRCPRAGAFAGDITAGPDGALYFSEASTGKVGRITTVGEVNEYAVPGDDPLPGAIVPGPDGAPLRRRAQRQRHLPYDDRRRVHRRVLAAARERRPGLDGQGRRRRALHLGVHERRRVAHDVRRHVHQGLPDPRRLQRPPDLRAGRRVVGRPGQPRQGLAARRRRSTTRSPPPGTTFDARAGKSVNATVATFTDADPNARASHYDALISWGDGDRSYGTVQRRADGSFAVKGKHTYDEAGLAQGRRPHHRRRREGPRREGDELGDRPPLSRGHHAGTARRYSSYCAPYRRASVGSS